MEHLVEPSARCELRFRELPMLELRSEQPAISRPKHKLALEGGRLLVARCPPTEELNSCALIP